MKREKQIILLISTLFVCVFVASFGSLMGGKQTAILGTLLIPLLIFSYYFPRWSLVAFLIYLPLGGTITYSIGSVFRPIGGHIIYTNSYPLFHLAKDAFYFPALAAIIINYKKWSKLRAKTKPLLIACTILGITCLLTFCLVNLPQQLSSTSDNPLLMGVVGLKIWLGYIPLILCGYYLIDSQKTLIKLNRILMLLILTACLLCLIQYLLLVKGVCPGNVALPDPANEKASLQAQCFVGGSLLYNPSEGMIRLPGTFVAPWQWAWFLVASSFISSAVRVSEVEQPWQFISFLTIISVLVASLISGQRTALLLVSISYLFLMILTEKRPYVLLMKLGITFVLTMIVVSQFSLVGERISDFIGRWQYSPPQDFIIDQFQWLASDRIKWLGYGLGRSMSAARRLGAIQLIEIFPVKLIYEIGILGFLAFLSVVTTLTLLTFRAYRSLRTPSLRRLGLCLWVFVLFISYNPYYYPLAVDPVAVYYWFIAGMILKLPELDQQQKKKQHNTKNWVSLLGCPVLSRNSNSVHFLL